MKRKTNFEENDDYNFRDISKFHFSTIMDCKLDILTIEKDYADYTTTDLEKAIDIYKVKIAKANLKAMSKDDFLTTATGKKVKKDVVTLVDFKKRMVNVVDRFSGICGSLQLDIDGSVGLFNYIFETDDLMIDGIKELCKDVPIAFIPIDEICEALEITYGEMNDKIVNMGILLENMNKKEQ